MQCLNDRMESARFFKPQINMPVTFLKNATDNGFRLLTPPTLVPNNL
jgi:hypothetical protein